MLIIEDGTGVINANSYVSTTDIDTYAASSPIGNKWIANTTALKESCAVQAAVYLDSVYASPNRLQGRRQYPWQNMAWPRAYCYDRDSVPINNNYIPPSWVTAQMELALRSAMYNNSLTPDITRGNGFAQKESVGPISRTFMTGTPSQRSYPYVEQILANIMQPSTVLQRG